MIHRAVEEMTCESLWTEQKRRGRDSARGELDFFFIFSARVKPSRLHGITGLMQFLVILSPPGFFSSSCSFLPPRSASSCA